MQGARASAAILLILLSQNIQVSTQEGFKIEKKVFHKPAPPSTNQDGGYVAYNIYGVFVLINRFIK